MNSQFPLGNDGFRMLYKTLLSFAITIIAFELVAVSHADDPVNPNTNYPEVATAINETMRAYHYDPAELDTPAYKRIEAAISELAEVTTSDEAFIEGFQEIWKNGPFSHVAISKAQQPADALANYLDTMRIGGGGAVLAWQGDVAVLTVNTMMGLDTIEEINAAYDQIAARETDALIIDLRENRGGAFAIRPLVSHLLTKPVDAGGFISRRWNAEHRRGPNTTELAGSIPGRAGRSRPSGPTFNTTRLSA